jgi:hypothetical protein
VRCNSSLTNSTFTAYIHPATDGTNPVHPVAAVNESAAETASYHTGMSWLVRRAEFDGWPRILWRNHGNLIA